MPASRSGYPSISTSKWISAATKKIADSSPSMRRIRELTLPLATPTVGSNVVPWSQRGSSVTVGSVTGSPTRVARDLFAPLAPNYEQWAAVLSLAQDGRWRSHMIRQIAVERGDTALDVAA